jgi:hypothetical protein
LDKLQFTFGRRCTEIVQAPGSKGPAQAKGLQDSTAYDAQGTGACPCHALQKAAAVNAIVVVVNQKFIVLLVAHGAPGVSRK